MNKKLAFIALATVLAAPAFAADVNYSIIGGVTANSPVSNFHQMSGTFTDENRFGGLVGGRVGYNGLDFELTYQTLGDVKAPGLKVSDSYATSLTVGSSYPVLYPGLSITGKVGVANVSTKLNTVVGDITTSGNYGTAGLGLQYKLDKNFSFAAEAQGFFLDTQSGVKDVSALNAKVIYTF